MPSVSSTSSVSATYRTRPTPDVDSGRLSRSSISPAIPSWAAGPPPSADYLRTLAISRLFLDNFYSLQGSWLTTGTTAARSSLAYGADDLGSIMLEENVVRATGLRHRMTDHSMVQLIRECGRIPALRDTHYRVIATYA